MTAVYDDQKHLQGVVPLHPSCIDDDHVNCPGMVDLVIYAPWHEHHHPAAEKPSNYRAVKSVCTCACHFQSQIFGGVKRWSD